ncbi:SMC-Scp complex subunit ScpB [Methylomusa anaerophila]|nr:SMC-Scp complex subunit ScpB [Methylomusa anaerophila]
MKGPIEALLFASGEPLPIEKIAGILNIDKEHVLLLIAEMVQEMNRDERGVSIVEVAGGYQMCTQPRFAELIAKLDAGVESKLSNAAMETLAIIAFKQPITKLEIETIRGVKIDRVLNTLLDRMLIKEIGRKDAVGRPILYGTTSEFLQCFGLRKLDDLPDLAALLPEDSPS